MHRSIRGLVFAGGLLAWPVAASAQTGPFDSCKIAQMQAIEPHLDQEDPNQPGVTHSILIKNVIVTCDDTKVFADEVRWTDGGNDDMVHATGNVTVQQKGLHISADRADINRKTKLGTFYNAHGTMELTEKREDRNLFGGLEPDVIFYGETLEKVGDRTYRLTNGGFTTCVQPTPRWEMTSNSSTITLDKRVLMRNVILHVKDVPILYLPVVYYPISKGGRATGFLMPSYSSSSVRGFTLSNAFFWAISRSQDATFFHDYFAKTGQGMGSEYRFVSVQGSGDARLYTIGEHARTDAVTGASTAAHRSYELRGNLNQALSRAFRLTGRANYFSDVTTQQLYQQNVADFSQRNRSLAATLTGNFGRYRIGATVERNDIYTGTSAQRVGHTPDVNVAMAEKPLGRTRIYFGVTSDSGYVVRQDDVAQPLTNRSLWRLDLSPTVRVPVSTLPFLSMTASASWHYTYWSERNDVATNTNITKPITRELVSLETRIVGPTFSRIFQTPGSGYAERMKHVIEPSVTLTWISPFNQFDSVVKNDSVDYIVGGTTTINYGFTNHLLAKRKVGGGPSVVREILTVTLSQSYYTDSRAAIFDQQYQSSFATTGVVTRPPSPFSPVLLTVAARALDSATGQFRLEYDTRYGAVRTFSASATLHSSAADVTAQWSKRQYIPGLPGFDDPNGASHYLSTNTILRTRDSHISGAYGFNYDLRQRSFLQQRMMATYTSQCCGISVDYQTVNFGIGLPGAVTHDRRFGVSFTLAGLGSFSNPFGGMGNNSGRQ